MRKLIALTALTAIMVMLFAACGGGTTAPAPAAPAPAAEPATAAPAAPAATEAPAETPAEPPSLDLHKMTFKKKPRKKAPCRQIFLSNLCHKWWICMDRRVTISPPK